MYPPPRPPAHRSAGVPVGAVIAIAFTAAVISGLGGCAVGAAIMATPPPPASSPSAVAETTRPATPEVSTPSPSATTPSTTPKTSKPAKVTMPKVTGRNGAAAVAKLESLGLTDVTFGSADPNASVVLLPQNWRVTKQDPRAGTKVARDTPVVLTAVKLAS